MPSDPSVQPCEPIVELARAKVNLTLEVLGRQPDGYHELASLVAFADVGDRLSYEPATGPDTSLRLEVGGPYGGVITGENLISKAARLIAELGAPAPAGRVVLDKRLPVSSGIGGGSTDAAAFLRAIRRAGESCSRDRAAPMHWPAAIWLSLAARIGADVPICLLNRSSLMCGIGDDITPVELPSFDAVLVTPDARPPADKTRRVFEALAAPQSAGTPPKVSADSIADLDALVAIMQRVGNALETPALTLMPAIADAKAALLGSSGCRHAILSGAGPTCAGVFQSAAAAEAAAQQIARSEPSWWVAACKIGD